MIRFEPRAAAAVRALGDALKRQWYEPLLLELLAPDPVRALSLSGAAEVALSDALSERAPHARDLVQLVLLEEPVPASRLESVLAPPVLRELVELGLLVEDGARLHMEGYRLVPFDGLLLVASPLVRRTDAEGRPTGRGAAVYLGADSVELCRWLRSWQRPQAGGQMLDLGTGTGIVALSAAFGQDLTALATEVDPEALQIARLNVALNGLEHRVSVVEADLFDDLAGRSFDLITANPPCLACPPELGYPAWGWGGPDGLSLVRPLLERAEAFLRPRGALHLVLNAYGGEDEPLVGRLVERSRTRCAAGPESSMLLARRRRLDPDAFRRLAAGALLGGCRIADDQIGEVADTFYTHYQGLGLSHEFQAQLRLVAGESGCRWLKLYPTLSPRSVLKLAPEVKLERGPRGLWRLETRSGEELTVVPSAEVSILRALDGTRDLGAACRATGSTLEAGLRVVQTYVRFRALSKLDAVDQTGGV